MKEEKKHQDQQLQSTYFLSIQDIDIKIDYMLAHKTKATNSKKLKSCALFSLTIVELS